MVLSADPSASATQTAALNHQSPDRTGPEDVTPQIQQPSGVGPDSPAQTEPAEQPATTVESVSATEPAPAVRPAGFDPTRRFAELFRDPDDSSLASNLSHSGWASEEPTYNIPIVRDRKVEGHMRFFHTAIRDRFERWLARLSHYKPLVERIFMEFDLPSDLVFLSLVESGFNPHAYSRARATGPWQFMKGTAQVYGLRVDQYVDERRDPIKSTVAAARYLRDLYDLFGAWPLAMAAYNAGEGKVQRALVKTQAESFWEIAETKHLRRETKEYVPRFMAAAIIAKNPDRYGFSQVLADPHQFEEVIVRRPMHLRDVAKIAGIPYVELQRLNPELRRDMTPPDDSEYHLKVPVGSKGILEQTLDRVPTWKPSVYASKAPKKGKGRGGPTADSEGWYRVRGGDSLATIAKRFRISVQDLKSRNNLTSHRIRAGDLLAITR